MAGQTSMHSPQPVQSSGATCTVYCKPLEGGVERLRDRAEARWRACRAQPASNTLVWIAACGQIIEQKLHWTQMSGCQIGISSAIARFSNWLVPVGHVPSGGNALTGSSSPRPSSKRRVTRCTKSGASGGTAGAPAPGRGHGRRQRHLVQPGERGVERGDVAPHDLGAAAAQRLLDTASNLAQRLVERQHLRQREEADLHDGVDATAEPGPLGDAIAVDGEEPAALREELLLDLDAAAWPTAVPEAPAC